MNESRVLDPCCGSKMFWFDKTNPDVLFGDKRSESHVLCDEAAGQIIREVGGPADELFSENLY